MKQEVKAIKDLAPSPNITEVKHMLGLVGYYRKSFPIFSDMIQPLKKLTGKNVSFIWTEQCQKNLDYVKQIITNRPILLYPDPDK